MSGWGGSYSNQGYGQQQGQSQQGYTAPAQQQAQQSSYNTPAHQPMSYGSYQQTGQVASASPAPQAAVYGANSTVSGYGTTTSTYSGQQGYGNNQTTYGSSQPAAYGHSAGGQTAAGSGAVAQAAQGLAPEQQAKLSQIVAQVQGGSSTQQTYGNYQQPAPTAQTTPAYQYGSSVAQQSPAPYGSSQASTTPYAAQQAPATAYAGQQYTPEVQQHGYSTGAYNAQQGPATASYGTTQPSSGYGTSQQASTYTAQQPQQQPSAAGYGAVQSPAAGGYGTQQTPSAVAGQSTAGQAPYGSHASLAPAQSYSAQQVPASTGYSQPQAARTSYPAPQQTSSAPQASYGRQTPARSYTPQAGQQQQYGSSYGGQATTTTNAPPYGQKPAVQQSSYTAAPQQQSQYKSAVPPRATGYSTPSFTAPTGPGRGTTGRPTGGASTQPSYGRPVVQPSVAARLPSQTHAGRGRGRSGGFSAGPSAYGGAQVTPPARGAPPNSQTHRAAAAAQVGQSARDISRMADAAREKRDEAKARERERDRPRESRISAATAADRPRGRDRERDGDTKKRDAVRSRSRLTSPVHGSPRKASPVRRKEPDYNVKLSSRPLMTLERDYHETIHRYVRLYVSADFSKVVSTWVKAQPVDTSSRKSPLWRLLEPVSFQHEVDYEESPKPAPSSGDAAEGAIKWNARVVLLAGLDDEARKELLKGVHHGGQHLHQLLKFLTVRTETDKDNGRVERSGITAIGGPHDASLDGPITDPSKSTGPLIATCVRHAQDILGVDLSGCKEWLPMVEVHYQRPPTSLSPEVTESTEISVIFLVSARSAVPEDWQSQWKEQEAWLKTKAAHEEAALKKEEEKAAEKAREKAKEKAEKAIAEERKKAQEESGVKDGEPDGAEKPAKRARTGDAEQSESKEQAHGKEEVDTEMKDAEALKTPQETEAEGKLPDYPRVLFRGKRYAKDRWRSASISLDGLLDYDEDDRDETTMELSLFAEAFQEMLAREYGERILKSLYDERTAALKRREERKKRKREEEKAAAEAKAKAAADAKAAEKPAETEPATVKTEVEEVPAPVKQETQNGGSAPEPEEALDKETKEEPPAVEGAAEIVKAEDMKEEKPAAETEEVAEKEEEEEGTPKKVAGRGKKGRAAPARGRGRSARGRGRKAEAQGDEEPEKKEAENGIIADKETPPVDTTASAVETAPTDKAEEGAQEKVTTKQQDAAPEAPAKVPEVHQAKDSPAADSTPMEINAANSKAQEGAKGEDKDKEKKKKKYKVDEELLLAFRYFDRNCCGYMKVDDLRRIVANLGHALSLRTVKDLCLTAAGPPSSAAGRTREERVYYRDITDKEVKETP